MAALPPVRTICHSLGKAAAVLRVRAVQSKYAFNLMPPAYPRRSNYHRGRAQSVSLDAVGRRAIDWQLEVGGSAGNEEFRITFRVGIDTEKAKVRFRIWIKDLEFTVQKLRRLATFLLLALVLINNNNNIFSLLLLLLLHRATEQEVASKKATDNKTENYQELEKTHIFFPVAIETAGSWSQQAIALVQEIGRRISAINEDNRETTFLLQRLSVALQRRNAISFLALLSKIDPSL